MFKLLFFFRKKLKILLLWYISISLSENNDYDDFSSVSLKLRHVVIIMING